MAVNDESWRLPSSGTEGFRWSHTHTYSCLWLDLYGHCHISGVYKEMLHDGNSAHVAEEMQNLYCQYGGKRENLPLGTKVRVVTQKCRGKVFKCCNLSDFNITTNHYKTECLCFLFSFIKINGKSLSTSKSHYFPQENEMVIVCFFIVISNCSCMC